MKSKMNRALSMLFALVMVVTVFPVMTSTAVAAETKAQGADVLTYEDLYVKDGLVAWFDAFGVNNATVDLVNGTWTDKVGGSVATVKGASTWWKFRENGGFGYDMTQAEWKASWSAVEVAFDINLLNETAFTFETFLTPYGPVDGEGNRSQTSDGWGNYNGSSTFINVGNLRTLQFGNHTTYSTFETRFVYTKNSDGWNSNQGAGSGITNGAQIRNLATSGLPVGMSFVYNHTVSTVEIPAAEEGGEPTYKDIHAAIYNCYKDGTSKFLTYNSQTTSVGNKDRDNDGDGEKDYWWQKLYYPVLPTGSLKIAGAFPSTVYSARVYDRILTSAEMARNHAADIIALTGADLSPITAEDEDAILFLVSALATMDGSATKAEVEAAVAKSVATAADCLYVTDGLILWLDGSDATTVDLANGKWYSKVGNVSATMKGTWKASTVIEGAGYRYDLESASANSGLDLPLSLVSSDYTLEFWAISRGLTKGADGVTPAINDSQWGGGQSTSMAIGFLVADSFAAERTPGHQYYNSNCSFNELAWYPAEKVSGGSLWATYAGNFNWGVRDSAFRYNGTTLNYTLSKNGTGVATYKNASVLQGFTLPSDPAIDEANHMFYLFRGFPVELYSVRMYDRTLSSGEVARNHFADLVKYTGISVASVRAISEAGYNMLVGAYAGQGFSSDKAALKAQLEEDIAKYAEFELNEYDDLYVKDGLVQLLTAFGTDYSTINTETGIWYSKAGASYATIKGGMYSAENPYGWKPRANGGIGYDLTDAEMTAGNGNNSWIDLGSHVVDSLGDYTLEYAASTPVVTDKATPSQYNLSYMTEKFGHWGTWNLQGNVRILYHMHGYYENHHNGYGTHNWGETNYSLSTDVRTYVNVIDNTPTSSYRTVVRNGVTYRKYELVGKGEAQGGVIMTKLTDPCPVFFILRNTTCSVYAIRMYDRTLTADEISWNHFVDLCAYTGADVSALADFTTCEKAAVAAQFEGVALNAASKEAIAAVISVVDGMDVNAEYDELYVQNGLSALFTAYAGEVDLAKGRWYSKVGQSSIQLVDNSSVANWVVGEDGMGVGYSFTSMKDLAANLNTIGMRLPTDLVTDGNMAIEYVFHANPTMQGDKQVCGVKADKESTDTVVYENIGDGYPWGIYNAGSVSSFSFAGLNMCQFQWVNYDGAAASSRFYYGYGAWESIGGGDRACVSTFLVGTPENGINGAMQTLSINRTVTAPAGDTNYNRVSFLLYKNGGAFATVDNQRGTNQQKQFYTVEHLNKVTSGYDANHAFFALPATVYSIRMYDRTLTEAERAQNHAVDLMAYFGMDVEGFADASENAKAAVYGIFADYDFDAGLESVFLMQKAIDRAVFGAPVGGLGIQISTDGKDLRILGALDYTENVSRVGFVITFKQDGEVVKTFGAASADNTTTVTKTVFDSITIMGQTAPASYFATSALYAAVVKNVPAGEYDIEVVPFCVDLDGNVLVGETSFGYAEFGN